MDNRRYARARDGDIPTIRHISHLPSFPRGFALENGQDAQPVEAFARFQIALVEMAIAEPLAEFFLRTGIFARLRRPRGPRGEQGACARPCGHVAFAAIIYPCGDCIFALKIFGGRGGDCLRRGQALRLPFEAPGDNPCQNARPLGFQLLGQFAVAFLSGIVTANGTRWNRRRMASSTLRNPGRWLPAMKSLN
jgi:hypothetical protein